MGTRCHHRRCHRLSGPGEHERTWNGVTQQSNATHRATLENVVGIDSYRSVLDELAKSQCADEYGLVRMGVGRTGSFKG
jgi:hypothetical protein